VEAWKRVRSNRGAAGVDRETLADIEGYGAERMLQDLDLREGREGFDFLGCHFHARVSGRLLEKGIRRYYLQRRPSVRSMKRIRHRVKELTGRNRNGGKDVRVLISDLNPVLRGWGNHFRTGNAARKFNRLDSYVWRRLKAFLAKRYGRNLRPRHFETMDSRVFLAARTAPASRHHPISGGSVTMRRRPSVSRVRENRLHGPTGGRGDGSAVRAPRP